jgi:hypothetical protein
VHTGSLDGLRQRFAAAHRHFDWLLNDDMFTGLRDGFGDREMCAWCCEYQDEIEIGLREKLVLRVEHSNFPFLGEGAASFGRGCKTADDLRAAYGFELTQGCHVRFGCHAQTDDSDAYRHFALLVATCEPYALSVIA